MFKDFTDTLKETNREYITFKVDRTGLIDKYSKFPRLVKVPVKDLKRVHRIKDVLELIYYWGQNDFQALRYSPSLVTGDTINFLDNKYIIEPIGFTKLKG